MRYSYNHKRHLTARHISHTNKDLTISLLHPHKQLLHRATAALAANDLGGWTRPAPGLYPHQWFWDSCFIAIGLAHTDPERAATELRNLRRGQWTDGMMPHMIYNQSLRYVFEPILWGTKGIAPSTAKTSGITQPPMLAIAVEQVAQKLPKAERQLFILDMLPSIIRFHEWIYRERDPRATGLAVCLHSWECGMDDVPYWTEAMEGLPLVPWYWRWLREYRVVNPEERARPHDLQHMLALARVLKAYRYRSRDLIKHSPVIVEDLIFNSILAAANEALERLIESTGQTVPDELRRRFSPTRRALEQLWEPEAGQYFARDYRTGRLIAAPSIATFMPLYAGTASPAHAEQLRRLLAPGSAYHTAFALPTIPTSSPHFEPQRFWRGPVWVSTNWFVIRGLERYGFGQEARWLRDSTLALIKDAGFREYYNPYTGEGLGATQFSWSAALTLDLWS